MGTFEVETARWLIGTTGLEAVDRVVELLEENQGEMAVIARLRVDEPDGRRTAAAVDAARCRLRARRRWFDADRLLFTREALEQASDPAVSGWRARRFSGRDVVDLCASVGGDTLAIAAVAATTCAVDLDAARLVLLEHNAGMRHLGVPTATGDALRPETWPAGVADPVVHVDPARRVDGRRITDPRRTEPAVDQLVTRHAARPGLAVVLAPGVDADHPVLGTDVEVEYLQLGDDLVEAVAWYGELRDPGARAGATIIPLTAPSRGVGAAAPDADGRDDATTADDRPVTHGVVHRARSDEPVTECAIGAIGDQLVEVAAAAVRARLHDEIGQELGAQRLAHHRALLTLDGELPASPWYRARPVLAVLPAKPGPIRAWLRTGDHGPVEIALHGARVDPVVFWRALGRPPRGPGGIRIELVRRDDDQVAIVTRDTPRDPNRVR